MPKIARYERKNNEKINISFLIMTLNEEVAIDECLEYIQWADDVVVLDSFSTDGTEAVAKKYGTRWVQHKFENWAAQQNWAMENIDFKHEWVFLCDADERIPADLAAEMIALTAGPTPHGEVAYQARRRDYYGNTWIRRSSNYPLWIVRLFRPEKIRWHRTVNQVPVVDGPIGDLRHDFIHYPLIKGVANWIGRHNVYSGFEAMELLRSVDSGDFRATDLFSGDRATRRQTLKKLSFRLPGRPLLRFFFLYILKGGFLDGRMGLRYCLLKAIYQYLIDIKVDEMRTERAGKK